MAEETTKRPDADQEELAASEVPPEKSPDKAAGSLNPKERTPFYEAIVKKTERRRRR